MFKRSLCLAFALCSPFAWASYFFPSAAPPCPGQLELAFREQSIKAADYLVAQDWDLGSFGGRAKLLSDEFPHLYSTPAIRDAFLRAAVSNQRNVLHASIVWNPSGRNWDILMLRLSQADRSLKPTFVPLDELSQHERWQLLLTFAADPKMKVLFKAGVALLGPEMPLFEEFTPDTLVKELLALEKQITASDEEVSSSLPSLENGDISAFALRNTAIIPLLDSTLLIELRSRLELTVEDFLWVSFALRGLKARLAIDEPYEQFVSEGWGSFLNSIRSDVGTFPSGPQLTRACGQFVSRLNVPAE